MGTKHALWVSGRRASEVCCLCHDALGGEGLACSCGARAHGACVTEFGARCPAPGCAAGFDVCQRCRRPLALAAKLADYYAQTSLPTAPCAGCGRPEALPSGPRPAHPPPAPRDPRDLDQVQLGIVLVLSLLVLPALVLVALNALAGF